MKIQFSALALMLSLVACQKVDDSPKSPLSDKKVSESHTNSSRVSTLAKDPQFGWLAVLRDNYPSEFSEVEDEMRNIIDRGADLNASKLAMASLVKPFMDAHRIAARGAPDADLVAYLRKNTAVAEALLKSDPKACNDVFKGGLDPATTLPDATWKKMSDATAQLLLTARAAKESPVVRGDVSLTQEDVRTWYQGMQSIGAGVDTFAFLNDPALKAAATPSEKCRVRVQMMKGALALPEQLAAKITLNILK